MSLTSIDVEALVRYIDLFDIPLHGAHAATTLKQQAIELLQAAAKDAHKRQDEINDDMRAFSSIAYELEPDARVAYLVKRFGSTTAAAEKVEQMLAEAARVARWVLVTKWAEVLMIIGPSR